MIDRLFTAILTFTLLAGGTFAIGSALVDAPQAAPQQLVQLPTVRVVGKSVTSATTDAHLAQATAARVQ